MGTEYQTGTIANVVRCVSTSLHAGARDEFAEVDYKLVRWRRCILCPFTADEEAQLLGDD